MEQYFTSLNKRQTMLLLTAVTFGGSESLGIFDHLPDDEGELLRHRAQALLKIPREKRIPLLVQEIKRLVTQRRGQVWAADPEKLAQVLKRERPALVEVVLRALPQGTAEAVRGYLPKSAQKVKLAREVKPAVLNILRWKLEESLTRASPRRPGFKFSDVLLLKSREILTVCDRLGARALALAIAGLPAAEREAFFGKLNPDQRQFAARLATQQAARALGEADAKELLALYQRDKGPADAIRSAGAQRLARAALAQSPEFAARLVERHPGGIGQLLLKWIREERPRLKGRTDGGRTDVVQELERLEQKGIIDKPVRLPPPRRDVPPPRPPSHGDLPGGKVVAPPPRLPRGQGSPERPPIHRLPLPPERKGPYKDPIAERQARRAGVSLGPSGGERERRDPIAEREARRAGAVSSRVPPRAPQVPSKILRAIPRPGSEEARPGPGEVRAVEPQRPGGRVVSSVKSAQASRPGTGNATKMQRPARPGRGPRGGSG